jgi:hypothetical protein
MALVIGEHEAHLYQTRTMGHFSLDNLAAVTASGFSQNNGLPTAIAASTNPS